ncbi:MAG: glycosyltransferase family 4 protein, partial [Ferruginibacter sp.]
GAKKGRFVKEAVQKGVEADVVILSHINLLLVGWFIKRFSPKTKVFLFAHGIEIWGPLKGIRKKMLASIDVFLCVSNYTKNMVQQKQGIDPAACLVLNNCIDPFLPLPLKEHNRKLLLERYQLPQDSILLFTLTRLASKDRYKGYDKVMEALALIKDHYPNLRYLIGGGYDAIEKAYVDAEIKRLGIEDRVIITGYLPEEELAAYFAFADIYVMPSKKEGFGIVFIEAMYYGLSVIAGNADGSVDALLNGELGLLVNPESVEEIKEALEKMINNTEALKPNRKLLMEHFSYESYKWKLQEIFKLNIV